jgi:5-methylcytosine-specific restriction endonuclease McrA
MKMEDKREDKHLHQVYQRVIRDKKGCCPKWKEGFEHFGKWYHEQLARQSNICTYCRLPGDTEENYGTRFRGGRRGRYLELDRTDNEKQYSPENCVLACYPCNNAKSDVFSYEDFKEIGKAINRVKLASKKMRKPKGGRICH